MNGPQRGARSAPENWRPLARAPENRAFRHSFFVPSVWEPFAKRARGKSSSRNDSRRAPAKYPSTARGRPAPFSHDVYPEFPIKNVVVPTGPRPRPTEMIESTMDTGVFPSVFRTLPQGVVFDTLFSCLPFEKRPQPRPRKILQPYRLQSSPGRKC